MIVLIGDLLLDLFAEPLGSTVDKASSFLPRQGGAVANVAAVLGRAGQRCRMLASVGVDAHGDRLIAELREAGVDVAGVVRAPGSTGIVFIEVDATGERSFVGYGGGAEKSLAIGQLRQQIEDPLSGASWLHVGSGALEGGPLTHAARELIAEARVRGVAVSVDLNVRRHKWADPAHMMAEIGWLASQATLVRASEDDLRSLDRPTSLDSLSSLSPGAVVVLTRGPRGAEARVGNVDFFAPAHEARVVETTGAGDAFTAGLLALLSHEGARPGDASWNDGVLWDHALRAGHALGALAVSACGATWAFREGLSAGWAEALSEPG